MQSCRLSYFNIAFYAMIMGFGGLFLATHKGELVYQTHTHLAPYLLYTTIILFVIATVLYVVKFFLNPEDVKKDFHHPVKANFFPGVAKILFIFSIGFLTISTQVATVLWIVGAIWQIIFSVLFFRRRIVKELDIKDMNPLRFLPVVGNLIAPIAGVKLGFIELSWFFFSVGAMMWLILFIIIMNRIIFHHPLPVKLLPTLIILMAPPAVLFLSLTVLLPDTSFIIAKILYFFGLFLFLVIASTAHILAKIKFALSRWAYSFPMAALTSATMAFYAKTQIPFFGYIGIAFYMLLISIMLLLIYKTIIGISQRALCIEE